MLGFKRFDNAAVTISGIELAEKIKKGQFKTVTDRDNLTLRARLFSGWFLKFFPASAVG